jgi:hypothetical protein
LDCHVSQNLNSAIDFHIPDSLVFQWINLLRQPSIWQNQPSNKFSESINFRIYFHQAKLLILKFIAFQVYKSKTTRMINVITSLWMNSFVIFITWPERTGTDHGMPWPLGEQAPTLVPW